MINNKIETTHKLKAKKRKSIKKVYYLNSASTA